MKVDKENVKVLLTGYIDGELNEKQAAEVEASLEAQPGLRNEMLAEQRLKAAIRDKSGAVKAPAHLRERIDHQLMLRDATPSFWSLLQSLFQYRPVASSFAVALLIALALLPVYQLKSSAVTAAGDSVHISDLIGELVCLDCDVFAAHHGGGKPVMHRPAVRTENGDIWTILPAEESGQLDFARHILKRRGVFHGTLYKNARYIRVSNYNLL